MDRDKKLEILDIAITVLAFSLGCLVGKLVMENVADTWLAFNGPAVLVFGIGECIWWKIRKKMENEP